jgi:TolB-like protein/Flp pilus assembly protein TadD
MPTKAATANDVQAELRRILESSVFSLAGRLRRFLEYVVRKSLCGETNELKEYTIGLEVFDRGLDFDPRLDPIVRVEAGRLRQKLKRYYESAGLGSPLRIGLPKGAYVPTIEYQETPAPTASTSTPTLAVLTFADLSLNRDQAYLCEGMTEELIRALTKAPDLHVFAARSTTPANFILEGGLRRDGTHMRITARLKDALTGQFVWAENYDSEFAGVFAIQEDISASIAVALRMQLRPEREPEAASRATPNTTAYRLYLKARYFWNLRTPAGLLEAVQLFSKAIEHDPGFGLAHSGLADTYSLLGNYSVLAPVEARASAIESARKALLLAPSLAETHASMAHVLATCEWNWEEAEREYELAIELNPRHSTAHHWYAITCLMPQRRLAEAQLEIREAAQLDPVSIGISRDVAVIHWAMRDYAAAAAQSRRTLELAPDFHEAYWILGLACTQLKQYDEAIAAFGRGRALRPTARLIGALGHCFGVSGHEADARRCEIELVELSQERYVSPFDPAVVALGLGETERAFDQLERAFQDRSYEVLWLPLDPRWDGVRTHPRYHSAAIR